MNANLDELAQYVRETMPQSNAIQNLQMRAETGVVTFSWNGKDFLVKPSLEVFELKGQDVYVTGATMLMQATFIKKNKNEKVFRISI